MISVVEGRVTHLLQGHTREVAELAAAGAGAPRLLLSLSRDGNLRLWDVPTETCLSSMQTDASCIVSGLTESAGQAAVNIWLLLTAPAEPSITALLHSRLGCSV